jgi:hypothetical protein
MSQYKSFKYGTGVKYGGPSYPFEVRVEHYNRSGILLEQLAPDLREATWTYQRIGGCGDASFVLSRDYEEAGGFSGNHEIKVYVRDETGPRFSLFYDGIVYAIDPALGEQDTITVYTTGYGHELNWLVVNATYTNTEISAIVKTILDTIVVPNSDITYVASDIENTGYAPSSISFLGSVAEAFDTLAKLGGVMEYGVDRNRAFYFKIPSTTLGYKFPTGGRLNQLQEMVDFDKIVNQIVVRGAGTVKRTRNSTQSQEKYRIRADVIENTSVTVDAVADQLGDAILADRAEASLRSVVGLVGSRTLYEGTTPIPKVGVLKSTKKYGTFKYGAASYQGTYAYRVSRIDYTLSEAGLNVRFELGIARPRASEMLAQLQDSIRAAMPT